MDETSDVERRFQLIRGREEIEVISLSDFIDEQEDEYDWLMTNLLERQSRMLVAGPEGSGKSLLMATLAVQAAIGGTILGNPEWRPLLPVRTLYVEMEMGRRTVRRRIRQLQVAAKRAGYPVEDGMLDVLRLPDGLDLSRRSPSRGFLLERLSEYRPDLVVFDPLYRMSETDGMTLSETRPLVGFIDKVRENIGAASIIVHHTRKSPTGGVLTGEDIYGSSMLRWAMELNWIVQPGDERNRFIVSKSRDEYLKKGDSWAMEFGGRWPISLVMPSRGDLRERLLTILAILGDRSGNALVGEMEAKRHQVFGEIAACADLGFIERSGRVWRITDIGQKELRELTDGRKLDG